MSWALTFHQNLYLRYWKDLTADISSALADLHHIFYLICVINYFKGNVMAHFMGFLELYSLKRPSAIP